MSLRPSPRSGEVCVLRPPRNPSEDSPQRGIWSSVRPLAAGLALLSAGCSDTTEPLARGETVPPPPAAAAEISGKSVLPDMDTYVNSDVANRNYGGNDTLFIQQRSNKLVNRVLVSFPQAGITDSVGADSLVSATLEFTIKSAGNDWGTSGRAVVLHRMTRDWLEGGATWSCANDTNIGNLKADCPGNTWGMPSTTPPFVTTPVAQSVITNGKTGVVQFDVTSDVRAFLANQASNQGWMLKLASEAQTGTVVFQARESGSTPRLVLSISQSTVGVPALPPDSVSQAVWDELHVPTNIITNDTRLTGEFPRNLVVIMFHPTAPMAERQAALDSIQGEVVGGIPLTPGGLYYVRIQDNGTAEPLFQAIDRLQSLPQVDYAMPEPPKLSPLYLKPKDGAGWQSWELNRASATGTKWGLEAIAAPMAWGCSTGDSTIPIGVIDHGFHSVSDLLHNVGPLAAPQYGAYPNASHGTQVASIIGAEGNNNDGMTGVMWHTRLDLMEYSVHNSQDVGYAAQALEILASRGDPIINLSSGLYWLEQEHRLPANTPADIAKVENVHKVLKSVIAWLNGAGQKPLIVIAASNDGIDAFWSGTASLQNDFPDQVIIVAASDPADALLPASNRGSLVSVAAPGRAVGTLGKTGVVQPDSGTSMAAPFVAGLAGLLLSFDPRMKSVDLKRAITAGATAGGRTANGIPIINAYESLKEAARAPGAPLCGNRVWSEAGAVKVQRGGSTEQLFSTGGPSGFLNVFHGGRRIDWVDQGDNEHSVIRDGLDWRQVPDEQRAALPDTVPGGTYRSMGSRDNVFWASANHDGDKLLRMDNTSISETDALVELKTSTDNGATWTTVWHTVQSGFNNTTNEYVWRRAKFAEDGTTFVEWTNIDSVDAGVGSGRMATGAEFYPSGSKALLEIRTGSGELKVLTDEFEACPWASQIEGVNTEECRSIRVSGDNLRSDVYEVNLAPGHVGEMRHVVSLPGLEVFSAGVSEAEDEIMVTGAHQSFDYERVPRTDGTPGWTYTNSHSTIDQCQASWHSVPPVTGPETQRLRVLTPDMCFSVYGGGTISPSVSQR